MIIGIKRDNKMKDYYPFIIRIIFYET